VQNTIKSNPLDPKPQDDGFKIHLEDRVDKNHALVRRAAVMHWDLLDDELGTEFCATAGAPALPTRLMAGLMYLQHTYNGSDEAVVEHWADAPSLQYFCGEPCYRHDMPGQPTRWTRWRQRIGEAGCEWLLTLTIEAALKLKVMTNTRLKRVIVDPTVQEKHIRFPTDSPLYNPMRKHLGAIAHDHGLVLRQTYAKDCRHLMPKIGRYGHAKHYKRMRKAVKQVNGYFGRVMRDLQRQIDRHDVAFN
jgi:IS5 family transposase